MAKKQTKIAKVGFGSYPTKSQNIKPDIPKPEAYTGNPRPTIDMSSDTDVIPPNMGYLDPPEAVPPLNDQCDNMSIPGISRGLVILRVTLHKFMCYQSPEPIVIDFGGNLTGIVGSIGSGKSTILDGICFVLFGKTYRSQLLGINKLCHPGGYVEVTFHRNEHEYVARRGIRPNGSAFMTLYEDGKSIQGGTDELKRKIMTIVGMNYNAYVNTGIFLQDEVKALAKATPGERRTIFKSIFKLGAIDKAIDEAKTQFQVIDKDIAVAIREKETITLSLIDVTALETQKQAYQNQIESSRTRAAELTRTIASLEQQKQRLLQVRTTYDQAKSIIAQNTSRLQTLHAEDARLTLPDLSLVASLRDQASGQTNLEHNRTRIITWTNESSQLVAEASRINAQIIALDNEIAQKQQQYADLVASYPQTAREVFALAIQGKATFDEVKDAMRPEIYQEFHDSMRAEYQQKRVDLSNQLHANGEKQQMLKTQYADLSTTTLADIDRGIRGCQAAAMRVQELQAARQRYDDAKTRITADIDAMTRGIASANATVLAMQEEYDAYTQIDHQCAAVVQTHASLLAQIDTMTHDITAIDANIANDNRNRARIQEIEKLLVEKTALHNTLRSLIEKVYPEFQAHCMGIVIQELSNEASFILSTLTANRTPDRGADGRPRRYARVEFTTNDRGIDITVDGNKIGVFSGGEKTLISTAIRMAISIQLARMEGGAENLMLFIDEGDIGSLDESARVTFIEMLQASLAFFRKIVLITHIDDVMDSFDYEIRLLVTPQGYPVIDDGSELSS